MSDVIITPNMGLTLPIPGQETGPQYASDLNSSLMTVDAHDHSNGSGNPVTPAGLNINTDLPVNSNNLTLVNATEYNNLISPLAGTAPYLNSTYVSGGNLFFNDSAGNQVKITNAGSVNATTSGISSGSATASFVGGVLVVNSAVNTPANIQAGSILIGNNVANSKFATLQAPAALGADYTLTLPPSNSTGGTVFMTIDTSNNMGEGPAVTGGINLTNLNSAVIAFLNPTGAVIMYGGAAAPTGYLLCDGSAINRTTFAALFSAIGTAFGNGDGSTTFNVPDMRGLFPRGVTGASSNDPDSGSRTAVNGGNSGNLVGSYQADQNLSHTHTDSGHSHSIPTEGGLANVPNTVRVIAGQPLHTAGTDVGAANIQATGGNQSNPRNLYVNFIIKT